MRLIHVNRRVIAVICTLAVVFSIFAGGTVSTVSAHSGGASHFTGACSSALADTDGIVISRTTANIVFFDGGKAHMDVQDLKPCTNAADSNPSGLYHLPVNLQGKGHNGVHQFIQLGIGEHSYDHNLCGSGGLTNWAPNVTSFVFTPGNDNGVLCQANWFDPNNNGSPNGPEAGHDYDMSITEANASGNNYWRFCIDDLDDAYSGDCTDITRASSDGGLEDDGFPDTWWAGCEVESKAHSIGVNYGSPGNRMHQFAYRLAPFGDWIYTENSTTYNGWGTSIASYYHPGQSQDGLGEELNCYTTSHN